MSDLSHACRGPLPEGLKPLTLPRQGGRQCGGLPRPMARQQYAVYEALQTAADLFDLRNPHLGGLVQPDAPALLRAYTGGLYRFDQRYRQFCEAADDAEFHDWDILKSLRRRVAQVYGAGYVAALALEWNKHLEAGLLRSWRMAFVNDF